jgi:hypothetical protein
VSLPLPPSIQQTLHNRYARINNNNNLALMTPEISEIIRRHPRERLWVQPLEWTPRHLELLQIDFQEFQHDNSTYQNNDRKSGDKINNDTIDDGNGDEISFPSIRHMECHMVRLFLKGPLVATASLMQFRVGDRHKFRLESIGFAPRVPAIPDSPFRPDPVTFVFIAGRDPDRSRQYNLKRRPNLSPHRLSYVTATLIAAAQTQAGSHPRAKYAEKETYRVSISPGTYHMGTYA